MNSELEIIAIGTRVILSGGTPAIITAAGIRGVAHAVTYEASWMKEGESKSAWFQEIEFTIGDTQRQKIGFKL